MIGIASHRLAAVVAAGALVLLTGACSSGESDTGSVASTVTVTAPGSPASQTQGSDADTSTGSAPAADAPVTETPVADTRETATPASAPAARPASDFADGSRYSFASPSGQIQCRAIEGNFICQTEGKPHTVTTASLCGFYPGLEQSRAVRFGWFPSGPAPCATIIQGEGYDSPHTLGYGQRVTFPPTGGRTITCSSAVDGLTCTQVGGSGARGFFLSVDSFTRL